MKKIALILLGIVIAAAGFYLIRSLMSTPDTTTKAREAPEIHIEETRLTHTAKDGSKIWEIRAQAVSVRGGETLATGVMITFFKDHQEALKAQAQELLLRDNGDMLIKGEVSATGDDGLSFEGVELRWDEKRKLLWSDFAVKLKREDMMLMGVGFEYSPEASTLKIKQKAHLKLIKK